MVQQELIDSRVPLKQCKLAVHALHTHQSKKELELQESELLPGKEQNIWLNVTVKKIPSTHKFKPVKIPIAHPLVDPRITSICLITKDPQREYKDLLETHKIKFISRVVGLEKLKGKFKPFEARRMLLKENGLFLADERIIPLLPKLLGVKWFEAKKQPIPVCLKRKDLKGELERAVSSTYMNQNKGTCTSIKVGTLSQKPDQILANLKLALPAIAKHIQGGWDNIQALHIKTNSSTSLPIWSCSLDEKEGGRWNGLTVVTDDEGESSGGDDDDVITEHDGIETREKTAEVKGKKRAQDEEQEPEKPRKKAKGVHDEVVASSAATKASSQTSMAASASPSKSAKRASAVIDALPKSKKRKSDPTAKSIDLPHARPSEDASETAEPPSNLRKSSKSSATDVQSRQRETSAKPALGLTSKGSKTKKTDTTLDDTQPPAAASMSSAARVFNAEHPAPESTDDTPTKKKTKKDSVSIGPSMTTSRSAKPSDDAFKGEHQKKKSAAEVTHNVSTPLTKDELKQKRSSGVAGKMKSKAKALGGKSAKNGVLGKKVAQ